uniref:Uncharacterized protein n=1 Tax=Aegilops tauschii subsp. strangulata TaxID=200361 RepID=A0A453N004_AEGTS
RLVVHPSISGKLMCLLMEFFVLIVFNDARWVSGLLFKIMRCHSFEINESKFSPVKTHERCIGAKTVRDQAIQQVN